MGNNVKDTIEDFIRKRFLGGADEKLGYGDSLFEKGIIDSLGLLELIAFIEKTYGIEVKMSEIETKNFDSINKIARLIEGKRTGESG